MRLKNSKEGGGSPNWGHQMGFQGEEGGSHLVPGGRVAFISRAVGQNRAQSQSKGSEVAKPLWASSPRAQQADGLSEGGPPTPS